MKIGVNEKRLVGLVVVILAACFHLSEVSGQTFPAKAFEPRTLPQLVKINTDESVVDFKRYPNRAQFIFRGKILPSIVRVNYAGKSRPVSEERKKFIELWAIVYSSTPNFANLFQTEFLFRAGAEEYWLPVARQIIPRFEKDMETGGLVDLNVIRPGGIRKVNVAKADWIFLVEDFQRVGKAASQ